MNNCDFLADSPVFESTYMPETLKVFPTVRDSMQVFKMVVLGGIYMAMHSRPSVHTRI